MDEIVVKVNMPPELREEFRIALAKVVERFMSEWTLSVINEISEIPADDTREVKESLVQDVIKSCEETSRRIKSGEIKPITLEEFNKWCK